MCKKTVLKLYIFYLYDVIVANDTVSANSGHFLSTDRAEISGED